MARAGFASHYMSPIVPALAVVSRVPNLPLSIERAGGVAAILSNSLDSKCFLVVHV